MTPKHPCAFPGCEHGADPRWGGYCDGHGATTEREVENRHSAIVAIATEAVDLRAQVAALREQRRVLREALHDAWQNIGAMIAPPSLPDPAQGWGVEARRRIAAALDATKEEP